MLEPKTLKELCQERGIKLAYLAGKMGVSRTTLWRINKGSISPTITQISKAVDILSIPPEQPIVGGSRWRYGGVVAWRYDNIPLTQDYAR